MWNCGQSGQSPFPRFFYFCRKSTHITLELNKTDKAQLKEIIKKGILKRCKEWLEQTDKFINKELDNQENEFNRCMEITKRSRDFYKEAMILENYYRTQMMLLGVVELLTDGYISMDDIADCREEIQSSIIKIMA